MFKPRRGNAVCMVYAMAASFVLAAALFRWWLPEVLSGTPYLAFYPAVVAAAAIGGAGPGLLATLGSLFCVHVIFAPAGEAVATDQVSLLRLGLFFAGGGGMSVVAGMARRSRRRESLQAAALEAAANAMAITDARGNFVWVNSAFERLTGYTREEVMGQNPRVLKSGVHDDAFYRALWETLRRGETWHGEMVNRRKDGTYYSEEMTITPLLDGRGTVIHFIAVKQDITHRKAQQAALAAATISAEKAKTIAEEASKAKDRFLAVLSHELRTPLTPVVAAVSLLRSSQQTPQTQAALEMIHRNVTMEARLIDDLLDVTRIEQGKIELARERAELREIIERAVEVCRPDLDARSLHLSVDWGPGPYWVDADVSRLQQVFWNVLKNAVKFTPHAGHISITCRPQAGNVIVDVADDGIGIEPEILPRLFNAFEQGDRSVTRQFGGLGLGLAISQAMLHLHGGEIQAHSEGKGRGSTFHIRLPLAEAPQATPRLADKPPAGGIVLPPLRILLVEDHGDTAQVLRRILQQQGHSVELAGDVASGIEATEQPGSFDLLISDLGLPDGSGHDLIRALRQRGLQLPAIALSGYGQEQDVKQSRLAGFTLHLTKPVNPKRLMEAIDAVRIPRKPGEVAQ